MKTALTLTGLKMIRKYNELNYDREVRLALSVLAYGGHYSRAVNVGIEAVLRNDQRTLRKLVKAAHDDTGLIQALQTATGKKLAYLAHEF